MAVAPTPALAGTTSRVSLSHTGLQLTGESLVGSLSRDGRHVGFFTVDGAVVAGDSNNSYDAFVRDRSLRKTVRVSVSSSGAQGDAASGDPTLSPGGRYVAFVSEATNLMAGDMNATSDVFLRDRDTDADGIYDESGAVSTKPMSVSNSAGPANGYSGGPAIGTGRYVAFVSEATNLVSGDTNGAYDVFVRDRTTGRTTRVSVSTSGAQAAGHSSPTSMSSSGRWIAFSSDAANLVAGDTNGRSDVLVRDRDTDADGIFDEPGAVSTTRLGVTTAGGEPNASSIRPAIGDGRHVAFMSIADNIVPATRTRKTSSSVTWRGREPFA